MGDFDQLYINDDDLQPIVYWTCDICKRPNNMDEGAICQNKIGQESCKGNLEFQEDFKIEEVTRLQYDKLLKKWYSQQNKQKEDKNKLSENDWECEKCKAINTMDVRDITSAICKKCLFKNEMIEYMIKAS